MPRDRHRIAFDRDSFGYGGVIEVRQDIRPLLGDQHDIGTVRRGDRIPFEIVPPAAEMRHQGRQRAAERRDLRHAGQGRMSQRSRRGGAGCCRRVWHPDVMRDHEQNVHRTS